MTLDRDIVFGDDRRDHEDAILLDALDAHAPAALQQLWARYGDVTYWAATALTGDTAVATEAVVAAFVALERSPDTARGGSLCQHLVTTVRQECLRAGAPPGPTAPREAIPADGTAEACRSAVRGFTDQQLTAVALVMSQKYRSRQAARSLGVPHSTVCGLLREALTTLAVHA